MAGGSGWNRMLAYRNLLTPLAWAWGKGKSLLAWGAAGVGGLILNETVGNPVGKTIWNPIDRLRQGFSNMEGRGDANYQYTQAFAGGFKFSQIFAGLMTALASIVLKFNPDSQWAKSTFATWSKAGSTRVDEKGRIIEGNESIEQTGQAINIAGTALIAGTTTAAGYAASKYLNRGNNGSTPPSTPPNGPKGPSGNDPLRANVSPASETEFDAAKRNGNGDLFDQPQKAATGATTEAAEGAAGKTAKHSRGKLGIFATVGATGVAAAAAASLFSREGKIAELDQSTAPAVPKLSTGENIMLGAMTGEAAYGLSKGASLMAKEGLGFAGKRIPIVGGVLTMAFTTVASAGYALNGEFGRAGAELATGTVEAALNTTGLGLLGAGDAAREALRAGISTVAGEGYAPDKSGLRTVYEYATGTGDFNAAEAPAQTASVAQLKDTVANSEIQTADIGLDGLSSSFTSSAMMPVPASPTQSIASVDMSSMDNKKRKSRHASPDATIG